MTTMAAVATVNRIEPLTVHVRISKSLRFRIWLGLILVKLGVRVIGGKVEEEWGNNE